MNEGAAWYVIHTKPKKENHVSAYLESQGLEVFYPSIKVKPVNPRSSKIRPYFPGYTFVHADLEEIGIASLKWIPHAIGLVQFDGDASPIPDHVIYELKKRIEEIRDAGDLRLDILKRGDPVTIMDGPLAGYEAIFDMRLSGSERAQVLLEMLGRLVKAQVDAGAIEKK